MHVGPARVVCAVLLSALLISPAQASADRVKLLEGAAAAASLTPEQLNEDVKGYLAPGSVDNSKLPSPPTLDSAQDKADVAWAKGSMARADAERWQKAVADDASVYDRFNEQFGLTIDRKTLPRFVRVLNRVAADALAASDEAKKRFSRPRPFQRFQLKRVCGRAAAPKPETNPTKGTSYPSGHAVVSWAAALIMAEAAPANAGPIIARAVDYGESRVICGVHFPTDVEAGRILGAAVVDRLFSVPEFRRELMCAKREVQSVAVGMRSEDLPACQ